MRGGKPDTLKELKTFTVRQQNSIFFFLLCSKQAEPRQATRPGTLSERGPKRAATGSLFQRNC